MLRFEEIEKLYRSIQNIPIEPPMKVLHLYESPLNEEGSRTCELDRKFKELLLIHPNIVDITTERCYNIELEDDLNLPDMIKLLWILNEPFHFGTVTEESQLNVAEDTILIEIGPRLNFSTPFSSNAVSICHMVGIKTITRIELSMRYLIQLKTASPVDKEAYKEIVDALHDRMTQCEYPSPLESFSHNIRPANWDIVDVMREGRKALENVNHDLGLAFDSWDLDYYTDLFKNTLKRNPTTVECFDLAQSNSEHSRHWFFKGKLFIDNQEQSQSLIDMIISTQKNSNQNNVIKFSDNSSSIRGYEVLRICPQDVCNASRFKEQIVRLNIIFTAETHNFPTGVAPFSGATTGTGGRIRDVQAVGRGGNCIAGTAGYSVGNLLIPGYEQAWENQFYAYPDNLAKPLKILIEASNGASDYGNKFGEPIIAGFTRANGLKGPDDQRLEWIKPIMFTGGIGSMMANHTDKVPPARGMKIVKIGGPVYRIGVGGGSASSIEVQGDNKSELDFNAVQRGDAEMENKLNRVIRGCIEDINGNPILSIHDQGAGGNGNVLKELVEPEGAIIFTKAFTLGDRTVSTLELWGAEYQESNAVLVRPEKLTRLKALAKRERCPLDVVGTVTGLKHVVLSEETPNDEKFMNYSYQKDEKVRPFDLNLELVLGNMPRKEFFLNEKKFKLEKLSLNFRITVEFALERVLRHPTVCSKRFLTNKVDRCVTGLIAQQQCVGPLHTPISDYAVIALSMFNTVGAATSIGEQPIKGILCPKAGARMSVAEALTNLVFAKISCLRDVKCSGNWMWAAKLDGEGARLYRACEAMCELMSKLGIAIDGGKDSLSMAARVNKDTIKSPGTLVISAYAPCPDIYKKVTADMKGPANGENTVIVWIRPSTRTRLGGSILAQTFSQLGDEVPDVDDPKALVDAFNLTQDFIEEGIIRAGHDVSDGGMITTLIEMAIAGISGFEVTLREGGKNCMNTLFAEEVGWLVEVSTKDVDRFIRTYREKEISVENIGKTCGFGMKSMCVIRDKHGSVLLNSTLLNLLLTWEETSYKIEMRQANHSCVNEEHYGLINRTGPKYDLTFDPNYIPLPKKNLTTYPVVAVVREEGTNGDRELAMAIRLAGFEVWDVTMQDLITGVITMDHFRGVVFPGGFSYADVLGSAKGWAACLEFNERLKDQFDAFFQRSNTFSLGICNGCQLLAHLGWVGGYVHSGELQNGVFLDRNLSERFECRFTTVKINKTPSIMLKDMEGSVLGVWVAHGEGRFSYKNDRVHRVLGSNKCIALQYVDDNGEPTELYPMNPNGSKDGIAGICSLDGRHLALMPHPERATFMWQWPYVPPNLVGVEISPWMRLFYNAFVWTHNVL